MNVGQESYPLNMLLFSILLHILSVKFVNLLKYHYTIMLNDAIFITVLIISVSSGQSLHYDGAHSAKHAV